MNLQGMMDTVMEMGRETRSRYHVTIDSAIEFLSSVDPECLVQYIDGCVPKEGYSYRGYYSDLAFDDADEDSELRAKDLLNTLKNIRHTDLTGYKGGEYFMDGNTPIWRSEHGEASDCAWVDLELDHYTVIIKTKMIG